MERLIGVTAVAVAAALAAPGAAAGEEAPRIAAVEWLLPPGEDAATLAALAGLSPGAALRGPEVRRAVLRLYGARPFENVRVFSRPAAPPPGQAGAWVTLLVEALPLRTLQALDLRLEPPGRPPVPEAELRAAARLEPGAPLDAGTAAAAAGRVRAALARRGYRAAEVQAELGEGLDPRLALAIRPGPPTLVTAVSLAGPRGPAPAALADGLRTRPGAPLDLDVLDADVRALRLRVHALGFLRGRVGAPEVSAAGEGAAVAIPVEPGPRVGFAFRGNGRFPAEALRAELGLEPGAAADPPAIEAAAERLRAFYRVRGFAAARVQAEEVPGRGRLAITFRIEEGRRYRLAAIAFDGLARREERDLRRRLAALLAEDAPGTPDAPASDRARVARVALPSVPPPPEPPPPLRAGEYWEEEAFDRAAERMVDAFRADGWLESAYLGQAVALDAARGTVTVRLRFVEGERTHVDAIAFEGVRALPLPALAREARLAPGDPLVFERVEESRVAILRTYAERGHAYARVEAREDLDRGRHLATLRFVVDEGPRVRLGRVLVSGARRTRPEVVRRALGLEEGDLYDPRALASAQDALLRLGVFRSVGLRLAEAESAGETKDLAVEVAERPWQTLAPGVGFSIANGPRAFLEYGQPNLLGRALELSARAKVNYPLDTFRPDLVGKSFAERIEGRAEAGLRVPRLDPVPLPAGARLDLVAERLHRRAYDLTRVSSILGLDVGLTSRVGFTLQYELETDLIRKSDAAGFLTQADVERLRFDDGTTTLQSLRPALTLDFRDNAAHPHRGFFLSGTAELARSIGSGGRYYLLGLVRGSEVHTNLVKVQGTASGYLPVGRSTVLAVSLRGGRVFPLDDRSRTIVPKRFFLGGASTMRAFAEEEMLQEDVRDDVAAEAAHCATSLSGLGCTERGRRVVEGKLPVSEGGEAFLLVKSELRVAITSTVEVGLFLDLGNVWLDPLQFSALELRPNAGLGLRFVTPIGPAALDLGLSLDRDGRINERSLAPHFTIGLF